MNEKLSKTESHITGTGVASIARNAGYLIGARVSNVVARFVYAIALAYYLGPELYGLLNYGISWYLAFLSATGLGMAIILSREIGRDRNNAALIVSLTFTLRIFITVVAALACGVLGWFFESAPQVRRLLIVFSMALIGRSLAVWTECVFTGYEENKYAFRLQAIFYTLEVLIGVSVLLAGAGVMAVATIHAISWWFQGISGLILAQLYLVPIRFNWEWHGIKKILLSGLPLGLCVIMITWLQTGSIVLYRHIAISDDSLGQFALAIQAFAVFSTITMAAGMASLPVLSRSVMRQDGKDSLFIESVMKVSLLLGAAAGLAGLGLGSWLVDIIFGARYVKTGYLLGLVMWLLIPFTCANTLMNVYLARNQFLFPILCTGAGALTMSFTMPWLVTTMGSPGAVLAIGIGMGFWALSLVLLLARSGDLDVRQAVFRPLAVVLFSLVIFFAMKPVNDWLAMLTSWASLLGGTLLFGVLTKDERSLLASIKHRWCSSDSKD